MHIPLWLQCRFEVVLSEHHFLGNSADSIGASPNGVLLPSRHGTAIAADGSSVVRARVRASLEAWWRSKIETSEGARFAK